MEKNNSFSQKIKHINLLDIKIHLLTVARLHEFIFNIISKQQRALILNVNVHCFNIAFHNEWLRNFLNTSEITFCDGAGVKIGARILGHHIPERITYADWMWQLAEFAEKHNLTLFFLGAKPGIADKACQALKTRFPDLQITGTHHGYFNKTDSSDENIKIIKKINAVRPNILMLGFGMPLQERWLMGNWDKVDANIALTGGAVFDYISGELERGPQWMTNNSFEWLARLIIEPRRLWNRYIIGNPLFLYRILKQRLKI